MERKKMETQGDIIRVLDKDTINKIAAGEVIERPASVVKELVDNALDSGATDIRIEVEKGGKELVLIRDNGCGMSRKDAVLSFEKHATSKLEKVEDLESVSTMGFRGEALSSIASVARVELVTRPREKLEGTKVVIEGGKVEEISDTGTAPGTSVQVRDLFYNIPARRKYLKGDRTELAHITDIVMNLALGNPEISFTLLSEGKALLRNPGSKELFNTVVNLLGPETARSMLPLSENGTTGTAGVRGYVSKPELTRGGPDQLFLFVNSRPVTSRALNAAIKLGYYTKVPKGRYPVAVISLILDPREVDVNVHPRKTEVRFSREKEVCETVTLAVEKALSEHELVPEMREKRQKTVQQAFVDSATGKMETGKNSEQNSKQNSKQNSEQSSKQNSPEPPFLRATTPEELLESSRETVKEKNETYSYPVRDTEKRLRRSERLLEELAPKNEKYEGEKERAVEEEKREEKEGEENLGEKEEKKEEKILKSSASSTSDPSTSAPLEGLRVIGQVSKLYILAEKAGDLVIIDQHAAHERILYEQIRKMKKARVQELITPVTIELTPKEKVLMEEYIPFLEEYGFGVSEFGDNTYVVTFVPEIFGRLGDPELVHDIISDVLAAGKVKNETGVSEKLCKTLACRAAIKGGATCSIRQMEELLEQLKKTENPYSCPHGRPTIITFTREELDRMFARS